jgi:hypothetical protein
MAQEIAALINALIEIEDRIDELWDYHPENPNRVDVEGDFDRLQKDALIIQTQIRELGGEDDDRF